MLINKILKRKIKRLIDILGYRVINKKYILHSLDNENNIVKLDFDHVLVNYLYKNNFSDNFYFIQIGAFDGVTCDPLRKYLSKYNWKGIMMEPQPVPFKQLAEEYAGRDEITVLNAAISKQQGLADLFTIESSEVPTWSKGMASFNRENILKHKYLIQGLESIIKKVEVNTFSFEDILSSYCVHHLDLLQIDTEGFDAEIINMFPFNKIKPGIIHFESKHIPKMELERTLSMLIRHGYSIARDGEEDMMAVLKR